MRFAARDRDGCASREKDVLTYRLKVSDAMVTVIKVLDRNATLEEVVEFFADDHVHMALVVNGQRVLTAIERSDLAGDLVPGKLAVDLGTLTGRWVGPKEDLAFTQVRMIRAARRRLVVIDESGRLLGLLCLKRHGRGFCRNDDVLARQAERFSLIRTGSG